MSGGGLGGGLGGVLGSLLGVALAPETGGLSLALPIAGGALGGLGGNLLGDAISGEQVTPLGAIGSAVGGGAGGALSGALGGAGSALGDAIGGAGGASAAGAADPFGIGASSLGGQLGLDTAGSLPAAAAAGGIGGALGSTPASDAFPASLAPGITPTGANEGGDIFGSNAPPDLKDTLGLGSALTGATPTAPVSGAGGAVADATNPALLGGGPALTSPGMGGAGGATAAVNPVGPDGGILNFLKQNKDWLLPAGAALNVGKQLAFPTQAPGSADLSANNALLRQIGQNQAGGNLNPAQQAAFGKSLADTQSQIRAKYANLGLSGSTAEQQDLAAAETANTASQAGAITGNINQAIGAIGGANQGIGQLAQQQVADDQALQQAIMGLALSSAWGLSQQ